MHLLEQRPAGDIDAGIGCLGRQDNRNQQLIGIAGFQLGRGRRIVLRQAPEEFENFVLLH